MSDSGNPEESVSSLGGGSEDIVSVEAEQINKDEMEETEKEMEVEENRVKIDGVDKDLFKNNQILTNGASPELENEEETKRPKVIVAWQCLNPNCTVARKEDLLTANSYTLSYYGMQQQEGRKRKICHSCKEKVDEGKKELVEKLHDKDQGVLSCPLPVPRDMVILEDSDEEPVTDSSGDSEFEIDVTSSSDESEGDGKTAEERLNSMIDDALSNLNMESQFREATKDLTDRLASMKDDFEETDQMFKDLEAEVDGLRRELYSGHTATIKELTPVDLDQQEEAARGTRTGPNVVAKSTNSRPQFSRPLVSKESAPPSILSKTLLQQGQMAYAMRQNILQVWRKGSVEAVLPSREGVGEVQYKLRFEGQCGGKRSVQSKVLSPKHLAYTQASTVGLKVGTRCIGLYREHDGQEGAFYSGIIAEPPKTINGNRYLVFFDDGYASYIAHENVREVCKASTNVWEDVHPNSREFIQQYLQQYPERPMVKLVLGQVVKTEWDGKWWISKVKQVDASLVKLVFDVDGRTEWIYRGSTRLGPLFMELEQQRMRKEQGAGFGRRQTLPSKRRDAPYVEYRREEEAPSSQVYRDQDGAPAVQGGSRMVARKSTTTNKKPEAQPVNRWEFEGSTEPVDHPAAPRRKFRPHACGPACMSEFKYDEAEHKLYNVLLIPILLGWERVLSKHRTGGRRRVFYIAPCGRRCRSLDEVHRYLRITSSDLEIDFFNYDWWLHVRNEFKPAREFCTIKDLSYGKENVPVSCINSIDRNYPEYVEYSTVRLPQKNVSINTSPEFMTCCDCTDDCTNKEKCACWQMTIQGTAGDVENKVDRNAGYAHRRLAEIVLTGIFECNSKCSCKKTCLNRVVQHPLRMKLQVFKTEKRGWGIRTLHDIPQGSFICVYVGNLFESEEANKQGQNFGDEYFAELDMIEVVERRKDGYESDVSDEGYEEDTPSQAQSPSTKKKPSATTSDNENITEEEPDTEDQSNSADDEDFMPSFHELQMVREDGQNRRKRGVSQLDGADDSDDSDGFEVVKESVQNRESLTRRGGFSATVGISGPKAKKQQKERFVSTRKLYGKTEDVYIMDAKSIGNIGRYLNHSCNPNVFVQNVFVDTHDMRFPWIAFFASTFVRAGGELCWDYNYEVGSIPGKELYCSCGSEYCRGKLL